jgi:hypothetical protein
MRASIAATASVRSTFAPKSSIRQFDDLPAVRCPSRRLYLLGIPRKTMKTILLVAMVLIGIGCSYARASDNGTAAGPDSISVGVLQTPPLRTIGGVAIRVWAPVAPPYNAEANGDLAARKIWGGMSP